MLLVIDNYDSFTWNIVQLVEAAGADVEVVRNDAIDATALDRMRTNEHRSLSGILVSPGPGDPERAGRSLEAIHFAADHAVPVLGICLGMQALAASFGGRIVRAPSIVHGGSSAVRHGGVGLLAGLASPFEAGRYHSLCVDARTLPAELEVTATTDDGVVMALRHARLPLEGVQFHPESVLTPVGPRIIAAFLARIAEGDPSVLLSAPDFARQGMAA